MQQENPTASNGPTSDDPPAAGPLSVGAKTEIRCQVRVGSGRCNVRLAVIEGEAEPTGRTVADLDLVPEGHHGAWCARHKRATVYVVREVA